MKLSSIIINYRNRMQISQREFARRCGLSNSYISFIEKEMNPRTGKPITPTIDQYKKIADCMEMTLQSLFELLDDDSPVNLSPVISYDSLSDDEKQLVLLYRGADDRSRDDAVKLLSNHQKKDSSNQAI